MRRAVDRIAGVSRATVFWPLSLLRGYRLAPQAEMPLNRIHALDGSGRKTSPSADLKKKRLADALRRNLVKRKEKKETNPPDKPGQG